ncbi:MAG: LLM class flavin-dependent oxidoreductase [Thermomicrobiaceae bacterium]|nr:LLM class flavin-dependent oxidoreductase [Thermomicrobiaceae bacterium]
MDLPRAGMDLVEKRTASAALEAIARAETHGVPMIWSTVGRAPDPPTFFAAAAVRTQTIGLGTAIVPTYSRHPVVLATQALALDQLAPGRFRLGVGPSHRPTIEGALGLEMGRPLDHLREYVTVLRQLLQEGRADFDGAYFSVHVQIEGRAPGVPIYVSALRERAFHLAGEVADGAISWLCPVAYLRERAVPALRAGAEAADRPAPRLIAHVPVVMTEDRNTMLRVARPRIAGYGRLPFYAAMFADAGYPVGPSGEVSDDLLDHLVVSGDEAEVRRRLDGILGGGIDELLVMLIPAENPAEEEVRLAKVVASLNVGPEPGPIR